MAAIRPIWNRKLPPELFARGAESHVFMQRPRFASRHGNDNFRGAALGTEQVKLFKRLILGNLLAGNLATSPGNIRILAGTDLDDQAEFGGDVLDSRKDGPTRAGRQGTDRAFPAAKDQRLPGRECIEQRLQERRIPEIPLQRGDDRRAKKERTGSQARDASSCQRRANLPQRRFRVRHLRQDGIQSGRSCDPSSYQSCDLLQPDRRKSGIGLEKTMDGFLRE